MPEYLQERTANQTRLAFSGEPTKKTMKQKILQTVFAVKRDSVGRRAAGRRAVGRRSCGAGLGGRWLGGSLALPRLDRASVLASHAFGRANVLGRARFLPSLIVASLVLLLCASAQAQIVTGSNGSDGALDFSGITVTTNIVINMADHPTGIYQYTYVNIPTNVTLSFIPNANNTPVYWLVQSNVVISGTVDVSGQSYNNSDGGIGGPGGYRGGGGGPPATGGEGSGGGVAGTSGTPGGNASFGTPGITNADLIPPGKTYGNVFCLPLVGGSGGGGAPQGYIGFSIGGSGGGGAILIAANTTITLSGTILARPGLGCSASGSGGAIRLVATRIAGSGSISTTQNGTCNSAVGGSGYVRFDTYENNFSGPISGVFTAGFQPIIFPTVGQWQLTVTSVGGVSVSASPTGQMATPDAVLSAQQDNPIPIVVSCANLPLHSLITVSVKPANGAAVSATGYNDTGTQTSSAATISLNIPRGGGLIYATAATGN
jgi:hypothetical protein